MIIKDALSGQFRHSRDVFFADDVLESKRLKGIWPTITLIIEYWKKSNPQQYDSFIIDIGEKRESRYRKSGASKSGHMRSLLDIPLQVHNMIRAVYRADELTMDATFLRAFAKKFPEFRSANKL